MPDSTKMLDAYYRNRAPNELEKSLAAQAKQPNDWQLAWALEHLPPNDPRAQAIRRAQINGIPLTEEEINALFK